MKKVTKIQVENQKTKLRVAAYCRVSSGSEEQLASLEIQKSHYEALIKGNPGWELAGVYADEGISGTKLRKREAMLRMLKDCGQHKIDLILTKSISRFARNTTDCLEMVRKLKDQGIYVQFESENIHTESMDSELILSILGGLAEGESKSISLNSKWSMKRRFETGAFKHTSAPYGYDYKDGGLIPNAEEAVIVERIFREYLAGQGTPKIADGLNGDSIPSRKSRAWYNVHVRLNTNS